MESKQIRSSVIPRSMRFNGLSQPPLHREKLSVIERQSHPGFKVIPTKELCRVYLQRPNLLSSKCLVDAKSKPPHYQKPDSKPIRSKMYGEIAKQRELGRRYDQQNSRLKRRDHTSVVVDPLRSKTGKKESFLRRFSPLGFGSDSCLRDKKKEQQQYLSLEKNSKLCDVSTLVQEKDRVVKEVSSKLMVNTTRGSMLSCNDRVAADVKFKHISSSSGFISKDENKSLSDSSSSSPGCQMNSEEAHQPSPVSVLEPIFHEDMSDDDDDDDEELPHLDCHIGIEKQLDTLESESEGYSDGSGMEVSSDEEESVLDSDPKQSKDSGPIRLLDSSYIDDILGEVVLGDSLDLLITPKIFEKLEKKYYLDTSWKTFERRMLFDRVISGLVEIRKSFKATPTWKKPVSRRLGIVLSTCRLKQELSKILVRQEQRAKMKEPSAKVPIVVDIDEWLELEADDDDESVVYELESMLVDELLDEVVSFM